MACEFEYLVSKNHLSLDDIDYFIPHSANNRMLETVFAKLSIPAGRYLESVRKYANTSSASISLAWNDAIEDGTVKVGDKLALLGFGGGLTYAGICLRNDIPKTH